MTATTNANWTADMTPGEHASTVYARLRDAFTADPILAMFVPRMVEGFTRALLDAITVDVGTPGNPNLVVMQGMTASEASEKAQQVIESSPLSVLSESARAYLASAVHDGLYPITAGRELAHS